PAGVAPPPPANGPDMAQVLQCLEVGSVLTLFYQKKSQRPERRSFQVRLKSRQIVWSRSPEKVEGDGEWLVGAGGPQPEGLGRSPCGLLAFWNARPELGSPGRASAGTFLPRRRRSVAPAALLLPSGLQSRVHSFHRPGSIRSIEAIQALVVPRVLFQEAPGLPWSSSPSLLSPFPPSLPSFFLSLLSVSPFYS
uniref:Uncharacterized protein n=1 Tax=Laticauda laticaudata TaxID=8630 RepID=A0A8C5SPS5_LATLA